MNIKKIIEQAFNGNVEIVKKIEHGLRCDSYLVKSENNEYIFQLYLKESIWQAKKKHDVLILLADKLIPKVYTYKVFDNYAYLITEYKTGKMIEEYLKKDDFSLEMISEQLAKILLTIHSIKNKSFGWITDKGVLKEKSLIDFVKSEYDRIIPLLDGFDSLIKKRLLEKGKEAIEIVKEKSKNNLKPCLCWHDINSGNVLIDHNEGKYELSGFIDPGRAIFGIEEWDLAFIKMELCRNEDEFQSILKSYRIDCNREIDLELLKALTVIVELDCISIRILNNITLPIPYDTIFRNEITEIERIISKRSKLS